MSVREFLQKNLIKLTCLSSIMILSFLVLDKALIGNQKTPHSEIRDLAQKGYGLNSVDKNNVERQRGNLTESARHNSVPQLQPVPQLVKLLQGPLEEKQLNQLRNLLSGSKAEDVEGIAFFILQAGLPNEHTSALLMVVLDHWAAFAPQPALTFVHAYLEPNQKRHATKVILYTKCNKSNNINPCISELHSNAEIDEALAAIAYEISGISGATNEPVTHSSLTMSDAIIWANAIQNEALRASTESEITTYWIESEPEEAMEWALSHDDFGQMAVIAAEALSLNDPWAAAQIASLISDEKTELREHIYKTIIRVQADHGEFFNVVSILESLVNKDDAVTFYEDFIEQWAIADPQAATHNMMNLPESPHRDRLISTTFQHWSEQYPYQAIEYASDLPTENLRKNALGAAMVSWSYQDFYSTQQWIARQTPSITLDKAIARAGGNLIGSHMSEESLTTLISYIENNELRQSMNTRIANHTSFSSKENPGE